MCVDVIVPLPLDGVFTYIVPPSMEVRVQVGCRVVVPFGAKKYYTGVVSAIKEETDADYKLKVLFDILDERPIVGYTELRFWNWISDYYLCAIGDVCKAALPAGLKPESETAFVVNDEYDEDSLTPREITVLQMIQEGRARTVKELQKTYGEANLLPVIRALLEKNAINVKEELAFTFKPKTESRVVLSPSMHSERALNLQFDLLKRSPRQVEVLLKYLELSCWEATQKQPQVISRRALLEALPGANQALTTLEKKHVLERMTVEIGRLDKKQGVETQLNPLSDAQQKAYNQIETIFQSKQVCLLHGVTSSGKTELYIHLIRQYIQSGKQVLYLLPEIALTTQITERLKRVFGDRLGVYHSKFSDAERVEVWKKQLGDVPYEVILGVRSSIFLPFKQLGLVIVDEEHENSYKQQDPAPRYQARNAAIMLASMHGAKTLLGTATPSLETYYNASTGKYGLVELFTRHGDVHLPQITVVDIKELQRKKRMQGPFSPLLMDEMRRTIADHEQVILFQNRRGFAPMLECQTCGWVPKCNQCDVSLTYHKSMHQLTCHYCGSVYPVPAVCPACEEQNLVTRGVGTEKVEDELQIRIPEAKIARMDMDTTRSKSAYDKLLDAFAHGKTDVLVGTQMVSKGLDFEHVQVVGILNADTLLNFPDFRAHERAFQLMAQVAGRAGRRERQGLVILQTKRPDLPLIEQVVAHDYKSMYVEQLAERETFHYPPFYRLIAVYLKHRKEETCMQAAELTGQWLRQGLGERVLGPDKPVVARIQALHIRKILLKLESNLPMTKVRAYLTDIQRAILGDERFRSVHFYFDVDPM